MTANGERNTKNMIVLLGHRNVVLLQDSVYSLMFGARIDLTFEPLPS